MITEACPYCKEQIEVKSAAGGKLRWLAVHKKGKSKCKGSMLNLKERERGGSS